MTGMSANEAELHASASVSDGKMVEQIISALSWSRLIITL